MLAQKNRVCPEIFHCEVWICTYFLSFRNFEQLALALKNRVCCKIFHCIEYIFYHSGFEQLALALRNRVCLEIFHWIEYNFAFSIFEQLALALKTDLPWNFSLYWNIIYHQDFEQLALALKHKVWPGIFYCIEIFCTILDFWATCACSENRVCPEIFQTRVVATLLDYPLRVPMHNIIDIGNFMSRSLTERDRRTLLLNSWAPLSSYDFRVVHTGFQKRRFQMQWLKEFKWLAYSEIHEGSLCKWCVACVCTWCC